MSNLSIVIPTFNTAAMTLRCCRAALAALPDDSEVIVADDASTDSTAELLAREVPEVKVVQLSANRGFAAAANLGVSVAQGRIVLLLNSDALVERYSLRAFMVAFDQDAKLGVAGAQLVNEDGSLQWSGGRTPTLAWMIGVVSGLGHLARYVRRRTSAQPNRQVHWVSGAAMAFRREVWNFAGPLSDRYRFYCQDIDFCLSARDAGWRVRIIDAARVTHVIGATIASGSKLHHDPEKLRRDLLTFGRARYGRAWSVVAHVVLACVKAIGRSR